MQKNEFLLMNNIIHQIYSISDFDTMKLTFLNSLRMLIPYTCASILMTNHEDDSNLLCNPLCIPDAYSDLEDKYLALEEDDCTRWLMNSTHSTLIRENDLTPEKERIKTAIYKTCYEAYGLHYSLQLYLVYNNTPLGVVTLYSKREDGDFTEDQMFIMRSLIDHLGFRFYQEFHKGEENLDSLAASMIDLCSNYHLTNRESEVLQLIFNNFDNETIAEQLCISSFTLKKHIQNLYRKLDVSSRWDLLRFRE